MPSDPTQQAKTSEDCFPEEVWISRHHSVTFLTACGTQQEAEQIGEAARYVLADSTEQVGGDPDYSPAYQDEYQRLWHEAAAERDREARDADAVTKQREALRAKLGRIRAAAESDAEIPTALRDFILGEIPLAPDGAPALLHVSSPEPKDTAPEGKTPAMEGWIARAPAEDTAPAQPLEEVQRFSQSGIYNRHGQMRPTEDGPWMRFEDHDRIVTSLQERWKEQKAAADEYATELANIRALFDGAPTEALNLVRDLKSRAEDRKERLEQAEQRAEQAEQRLQEVRRELEHRSDLCERACDAGSAKNPPCRRAEAQALRAAVSFIAAIDSEDSLPTEECERCGGSGEIEGEEMRGAQFVPVGGACPDCKPTGRSGLDYRKWTLFERRADGSLEVRGPGLEEESVQVMLVATHEDALAETRRATTQPCPDCTKRQHDSEGEEDPLRDFWPPVDVHARKKRWTGVANIAWCPTHGLHGARDTCFECGELVEQIPMLPVAEIPDQPDSKDPVGLGKRLLAKADKATKARDAISPLIDDQSVRAFHEGRREAFREAYGLLNEATSSLDSEGGEER